MSVLCLFCLFFGVYNRRANAWRELLLACIGEQFATVLAKGDDICGLTVSIRQYDNILQLWNRDANGHIDALFSKVKSILPGVELTKAFYKPHKQHTAFGGNAPAAAGHGTAPVAIPGSAAPLGVASSPVGTPPPGFAPKH